MRILLILFMFLSETVLASTGAFSSVPRNSKSLEFESIDRHALNVPRKKTRSIKHLVPYLIRPARNEREKARAIYRWITENIAYDTKSYFSGRYRNRRVKTPQVLKRRRGVCDAYASLFRDMAEMAGLKVTKISGYAKGFGYEPGSPDSNENHAWNAVRVDGEWLLVDATWGAGVIEKKSRRFKKQFREFYFLSMPEEFIFSHFPKEDQWQLLKKPRSMEEFNNTVLLKPDFFELGLGLDSHDQAVIRANGELDISLYVPQGSEIMANLFKSNTPLDRHHFYWERIRDKIRIYTVFPRAGEYRLYVYGREKNGAAKSYPRVMEYKISASNQSQRRFPLFHDAYFNNGIRIDSHKEGVIHTGGQLELWLNVPVDVKLSARIQQDSRVLARDLVFAQREGKKFRIHSVFPEAGEYALQFFSTPPGGGDRVSTLQYTIVAEEGGGNVRFPTLFKKFQEWDAYLYSPMNNLLSSGELEYFKIRVPGAQEVAVAIGDQWYFLKKKGELFSGRVPISVGEITIMASTSKNKPQYSSLLKYDGI